MQILGYIVSKGKVKTKLDFIQQVDSMDKVEENKPCLVIGLSEAKKIALDKFSILSKQFDKFKYWTFGRTERREENEKDILNFYNYIIDYNLNNIKYYYINILNINFNILKRLIKLCNSNKKKYIYIWNDMIFILCENDSVVGISIKMLHYCGCNLDKILSKLKANSNNFIKDDDKFISYKLKARIKDKHYTVPYIMKIMEM